MDAETTETNPTPPPAPGVPAIPVDPVSPLSPPSPRSPAMALAAPPAKGDNGGRGMIIGLAACWVAAGLFVAPLETLAWLICVGSIVALAWWLSVRMDERVYERLANGQCAQCGYDLQSSGSSGDCPKCGAWFGPGWGAAMPKDKKEGSGDEIAQPNPNAPEQVTSSPQIATAPADERKCA
jgi:hypothetical protein